ncbi:hypothetical protein BI084_gp89 [Gordonia phage Terapin]|uniref:Uncharacterized protein n=4 Tax=Terapinvirus terapin TaxID=2734283 RepID=A0A345MBC8_9CAUD|nr:hypothetical protein BI084_gp89 [Gordonia phage Terapin]AOE44901.1 hypothetical protein SEA_TERAPIN_89 [Gordonia phage Terapin]AVP43365.1 hypothetical protein PBI_DJOKOVIC_88 [Gordonia phage Djokovic]AXH67799.1 hypothetical protein SEA_BEYONCAGE_88 [Gordonia phage Beyoncage]QOC56658.1 hypothetical protein SEA_BITESIZE_88 [Gordonia phage BiteSize]
MTDYAHKVQRLEIHELVDETKHDLPLVAPDVGQEYISALYWKMADYLVQEAKILAPEGQVMHLKVQHFHYPDRVAFTVKWEVEL